MPIMLNHGGIAEAPTRTRAMASAPDFDYMFMDLVPNADAHLPDGAHTADTVRWLLRLGDAMIDESDAPVDNSTIPAVYTYWGQFINHDITALADDTNGERLERGVLQPPEGFRVWQPEFTRSTLVNLRDPRFDLDSVYDRGPDEDTLGIFDTDRVHLALGTNVDSGPERTPQPELGLQRDVPRFSRDDATDDFPERAPRIGDRRNDENLIISQFHAAMLHFHNAVVDWVRQAEGLAGAALLSRAQTLTRWHFQWLVVEDYLRKITLDGTVDTVLESIEAPNSGQMYMPLEFSVAAFRFGHSMVRNEYDYNQNFGHPNRPVLLDQFFNLTWRGGLSPTTTPNPTLPSDWIIEWERFVGTDPQWPSRFARRIDTNLAPRMLSLIHEWRDAAARGFDRYKIDIFKHMARRNLLRGYLLRLPVGQAVAGAIGAHPLSPQELNGQSGERTQRTLQESGFLEKTPLWYYILKEAEVEADGDSLGSVGSHIVAHTLIGMLKADPSSYLHHGWDPASGVQLPGGREIRSILDLFRFARVAV